MFPSDSRAFRRESNFFHRVRDASVIGDEKKLPQPLSLVNTAAPNARRPIRGMERSRRSGATGGMVWWGSEDRDERAFSPSFSPFTHTMAAGNGIANPSTLHASWQLVISRPVLRQHTPRYVFPSPSRPCRSAFDAGVSARPRVSTTLRLPLLLSLLFSFTYFLPLRLSSLFSLFALHIRSSLSPLLLYPATFSFIAIYFSSNSFTFLTHYFICFVLLLLFRCYSFCLPFCLVRQLCYRHFLRD